MNFGPRPTGSQAHRQTGDYIKQQLEAFGWAVVFQEFDYLGTPARNIIATRGRGPMILLVAHYDTRRRADHDPSDPAQPVPGASDGASGVAVLLELARVLNVEATGHRIRLAFFDAEDNGGLDGWDWIAGSRHMAQFQDALDQWIARAWGLITGSNRAPDTLSQRPEAMILVDMVGDIDQQLYWEQNSNADLNRRVWQVAAELGYGAVFVAQPRHSLLDDHTPFLQRGIPAIDIIDFDYPFWHTAQDTLDKIGADSLERVGRTLEAWLERGAP